MARVIKWSYRWRLVVTTGFRSSLRPFQGRRQCAAYHFPDRSLIHLHRPLSRLFVFLPWGTARNCSFRSTHSTAPIGIRSGFRGAHDSALDVQSTFLVISRSTTAGHFPPPSCWNHKLCLTVRGTTWSSPGGTVSRKSLLWAGCLPGNNPTDWKSTLSGSMSIIPRPEEILPDVEHTLACKTYFACPQRVHPQCADVLCTGKSHPQDSIVRKQLWAQRIVVWMESTVMKCFEGRRLGEFQF
jgi:hypothetical protein